MFRLRLLAAIASLFLAAGAPAQEATQQKAQALMAAMLQRELEGDTLQQRIAVLYGGRLDADKSQVVEDVLRRTYANPHLAEYLGRLTLALYRQGASNERMRATVPEAMQLLKVRGIARLPAEDQASFLRYMLRMAGQLPAETCAAMFLGKLPEKAVDQLESDFAVGVDLQSFKEIMDVYGRATLAELDGDPPMRSVSLLQASQARDALVRALAARLRETMSPQAVQRIARDIKSAPEGDVCTYMRNVAQAVLDLPEPERGWQLVAFTEAMRGQR
ncbi:hypothetical protein HHL11_01045 [Ramlibacter sp. G-1-2-2]|uniref:DUF2059 domain-containing protein n=1 Tax=Ramlibacter agri TaxID=2728837 RepID=A0A848GUL5_9BURK|nr:hypothetical protein [Ramlibacter agri]NML42315.1 hypothetical protein [Ramlibacter agri]